LLALTCLNFYFIYVYLRKCPCESDIEFDAEAALRPPMLAVDDPSPKAPDLESSATSAAPGVVDQVEDCDETETNL
jgi:hypothetical protein